MHMSAHHSVATNIFFIALKTLNHFFVFNAYECASLCGKQSFFIALKTLNPFFVFNAYECTSPCGNQSFFIALKP